MHITVSLGCALEKKPAWYTQTFVRPYNYFIYTKQ